MEGDHRKCPEEEKSTSPNAGVRCRCNAHAPSFAGARGPKCKAKRRVWTWGGRRSFFATLRGGPCVLKQSFDKVACYIHATRSSTVFVVDVRSEAVLVYWCLEKKKKTRSHG